MIEGVFPTRSGRRSLCVDDEATSGLTGTTLSPGRVRGRENAEMTVQYWPSWSGRRVVNDQSPDDVGMGHSRPVSSSRGLRRRRRAASGSRTRELRLAGRDDLLGPVGLVGAFRVGLPHQGPTAGRGHGRRRGICGPSIRPLSWEILDQRGLVAQGGYDEVPVPLGYSGIARVVAAWASGRSSAPGGRRS